MHGGLSRGGTWRAALPHSSETTPRGLRSPCGVSVWRQGWVQGGASLRVSRATNRVPTIGRCGWGQPQGRPFGADGSGEAASGEVPQPWGRPTSGELLHPEAEACRGDHWGGLGPHGTASPGSLPRPGLGFPGRSIRQPRRGRARVSCSENCLCSGDSGPSEPGRGRSPGAGMARASPAARHA